MSEDGTVLSPDEVARYARHLVLPEVGGPGQRKLKAARVLVVGAGGLGAPLIAYLAAAGVGTIGIVDEDTVALSNLQRQIIHGTGDLGRRKVDSAADAVAALNPHVAVERHAMRLDIDNAEHLLSAYDVIADGSDNFATRFLVADVAERLEKPLVTAAVGRFDGSLTTLRPFERDEEGVLQPSYRCLFPEPPPEGLVPACAEAGILGALTGVLGTLQALEVLKAILGIGEPLVGRLLLVDALSFRFETIRYRRRRP
ncbi:molybdopterin/thiamine biosynthesis adenylyltransferase [Prosthecomicrobium pneumaticum]|uniref:Molybdopterin-synthase adenylyltransferase n=2 Tax=Prosthecomicrobium pneumaticum TaxID=81895 RepID=A0A7W9FM76_9HYPH|nr:molybdopterin/thiamine biosynthesis adenylyltransferase [Prosthecomicrobium pneumaticum]